MEESNGKSWWDYKSHKNKRVLIPIPSHFKSIRYIHNTTSTICCFFSSGIQIKLIMIQEKNVFDLGNYSTQLIKVVEPGTCCSTSSIILPSSPPKPLIIGTPTEAGLFPVLLLIHGYLLYNSFYSGLIQHIASHGFIVVVPQV